MMGGWDDITVVTEKQDAEDRKPVSDAELRALTDLVVDGGTLPTGERRDWVRNLCAKARAFHALQRYNGFKEHEFRDRVFQYMKARQPGGRLCGQ